MGLNIISTPYHPSTNEGAKKVWRLQGSNLQTKLCENQNIQSNHTETRTKKKTTGNLSATSYKDYVQGHFLDQEFFRKAQMFARFL